MLGKMIATLLLGAALAFSGQPATLVCAQFGCTGTPCSNDGFCWGECSCNIEEQVCE